MIELDKGKIRAWNKRWESKVKQKKGKLGNEWNCKEVAETCSVEVVFFTWTVVYNYIAQNNVMLFSVSSSAAWTTATLASSFERSIFVFFHQLHI